MCQNPGHVHLVAQLPRIVRSALHSNNHAACQAAWVVRSSLLIREQSWLLPCIHGTRRGRSHLAELRGAYLAPELAIL